MIRLRQFALILPLVLCLHGSVHAQTSAPAASAPDVALLNRTVLELERAKTLDSVAQMQLRASGPGLSYDYGERVHFVLLKPDRYHADITLRPPGGAPITKFAVVCDGTRVWVYQPATERYALMPRATFEQNDLGGLGLFGSLVRSSVGDSANAIVNLNGLTKSGIAASSGTMTVGGTVCPVFSMTDPKLGDTLRLALDPQTATIRGLGLDARQSGLTITVTETVTRQESPSALPASLFQFTPPPGARRVETLAIGPF